MRKSSLLVACIVALVLVAAVLGDQTLQDLYRPSWSADGRSASHEVHIEQPTGERLHLQYAAALHERAVLLERLDQQPLVVKCTVDDPLVALVFGNNADAARFASLVAEDSLVAGGLVHTCTDNHALLVRVTDVAQMGNVVELQTKRASPHDFFADAQVSFNTNSWPKTADRSWTNSNIRDVRFSVHERQRSIWSWLSGLWRDAVSFVEDVYDLIKKYLPQIEQLVLTGALNFTAAPVLSHNLSYNYPNPSPIPIPLNLSDVTLTCTQCYAYLDLAIDFSFSVSQYELVNLSIIGVGDAQVSVTGDLEASITKTFSWSATIADISPPPLVIPIAGIPFSFSFSMPVQAGASADLRADATAIVHAQASGKYVYGVSYDPQTRALVQSSHHSYDAAGSLERIHAGFDANLNVFLAPTPSFSVDYIGSVYFSINGAVQLNVDANAGDGSSSVCGDNSVYIAATAMAQVTYGAEVGITVDDVSLFSKQWGPTMLYSNQWPLDQGCLSFAPNATIVNNPVVKPAKNCCVPAQTWTGYQKQLACFDFLVIPPGNVSMQLIQDDDDGIYYVIAANENFNNISGDPYVYGTCISQVLYQVVQLDSTQMQIVPATNQVNSLNWASCTMQGMVLEALPMVGNFTQEFEVIDLYPITPGVNELCGVFHLERPV